MPIRIVANNEHQSEPAVLCDYCKGRIERAEDGNVEWRRLDVAEVNFTHKQCSDAFRKANPYVTLLMELVTFPLRLLYSLKIDLQKAQEMLEKPAGL